MFSFFGDSPESNEDVAGSILNQLDVVIIRKLVVYLLKHRAALTSSPQSARLYNLVLDSVKDAWRDMIEVVKEAEIRPVDTPVELVERIVYALPASLLDLNAAVQILSSSKQTFLVFAGEAHTDRIREWLKTSGFYDDSISSELDSWTRNLRMAEQALQTRHREVNAPLVDIERRIEELLRRSSTR